MISEKVAPCLVSSSQEAHPLVSVVLGVKDRYDYRVVNALKSIRWQTYEQARIEIVLVDYGSDPSLYPLFRQLCERFDVRGVWTKIRSPWSRSHCLNIGIKKARGEYLLLSDTDMILEKNYIDACVAASCRDSASAFYCRMMDLPEGAITVEIEGDQDFYRLKEAAVYRGDIFKNMTFPFGESVLFVRADAVRQIGGYDEYFKIWGSEDRDLNKRLRLNGVSVRLLGGQTSHLHQWHQKYENVKHYAEFEEQRLQNDRYYKKTESVQRNLQGWGKIDPGKDLFAVPLFPRVLPGTFWGITTFYNPARYNTKLVNYRAFREASRRQGLNLLAVELAFGSAPFELGEGDADILVQIRATAESVLWQKEALLNIAFNMLPQDCDKFAWIDCDVVFKNDHWISETCARLEEYMVVQPYAYVGRMNQGVWDVKDPSELSDGLKLGQKWHGIAYGVSHNGRGVLSGYMAHGCPGYAWAARREVFEGCGFFDRMILGSADLIMAYAFYDNDNANSQRVMISEELLKDRLAWAKIINGRVSGSVSYTPGLVLHLWHGDIADRLYESRDQILRQQHFDPVLDIKKDEVGIWQWASVKPELHRAVFEYFHRRNEDGLSVAEKAGLLSGGQGPQETVMSSEDVGKLGERQRKSFWEHFVIFRKSSNAGQQLKKVSPMNMEQRYLAFLAWWGHQLRRYCPCLYGGIKKYFPDRLAGQKIAKPYLTSLSTLFYGVILLLVLFCLGMFWRDLDWGIFIVVLSQGAVIAVLGQMKNRQEEVARDFKWQMKKSFDLSQKQFRQMHDVLMDQEDFVAEKFREAERRGALEQQILTQRMDDMAGEFSGLDARLQELWGRAQDVAEENRSALMERLGQIEKEIAGGKAAVLEIEKEIAAGQAAVLEKNRMLEQKISADIGGVFSRVAELQGHLERHELSFQRLERESVMIAESYRGLQEGIRQLERQVLDRQASLAADVGGLSKRVILDGEQMVRQGQRTEEIFRDLGELQEHLRLVNDGLSGKMLACQNAGQEQMKRLEESEEKASALVQMEFKRMKDLVASIKKDVDAQSASYKQIEAMFSVFSLLPLVHPLPPMRSWAIAPDLACVLIDVLRTQKPRLVVELGAGVSTIVMAYILKDMGQGRIVSLEHDAAYVEKWTKELALHGLGDIVTVVHAPLSEVVVGDKTWQWYEKTGVLKCVGPDERIDLLFVDGPPGMLQPLSRYPAIPVFAGKLAAGSMVILDDAARDDEKAIAASWLQEYPFLKAEYRNTEKGAMIFSSVSPRKKIVEGVRHA